MTAPFRSGVLPVDKGRGVTSFQVVAHVRRLLRVPKVGHGGTLDPEATGVLPILIGEATKLMPYLSELDKEYLATVRLGVVTDTQDASGSVVAERPVPPMDQETVGRAVASFVGEIQQVPPMYSALHHEGKRLHELARKGMDVERPARAVTVHAITLESLDGPTLGIRVRCGKGTYVRTLAADIGQALGCGGCLERLIRTRVGPYRREQALAWEELRDAQDGSPLWSRLLPPDSALQAMPAMRLEPGQAEAFRNGQPVPASGVPAGLVRVYTPTGALVGVGLCRGHAVKPERILHADPSRARELSA